MSKFRRPTPFFLIQLAYIALLRIYEVCSQADFAGRFHAARLLKEIRRNLRNMPRRSSSAYA
jgi:hypothetical protein